MQSSAIAPSSTRSTYIGRIRSVLTPIHKYSISQDGEIISRGSVRYGFVSFCEPDELCALLGKDAAIGRCIGYIRDCGTYYIRCIVCGGESMIALNGPCGCEIFKRIR